MSVKSELRVVMHADVVGSTSLFQQHGLDVHDHMQSGLRRLSDAIRAYSENETPETRNPPL